jgi:thiol-disulfide isomerase/thioredoxin
VARWVAYGKQGWARSREGDAEGADASFVRQIQIFPGNPEPYVARALLAAGRKDNKAALEHLKEAVARGFTDFPRLDRSEPWSRLKRNETYLGLVDTVPKLLEIERAWPAWRELRAFHAPKDVATALADRAALDADIARMAPALGPRLTSLWHRTIARATAARFERYLAHRSDAPDVADAVRHFFSLCAGEADLRWEVPSTDDARQFKVVADLTRKSAPGPATEEGALVFTALAWNGQRNWKGVLDPSAADPILASLDRLLADHPTSPFVPLAAEGAIRTEVERGRLDRAAERYRSFRQSQAVGTRTVELVRDRLGALALQLGGLPAFTATTLDGAPFGSDALRGKVAVLDFWATWCQPCVQEMPTLRRIQEQHGENVVLVGVSLDGADDLTPDELRAWTAQQKVPGRQLHDGRGWESDLVRSFGVREIPFTVVFNPDGSVRSMGARGKELERAVQTALKQ